MSNKVLYTSLLRIHFF
uniref:Uncharacterized protein n=1 Tax=Arundo donax TaxID=35708 RepID=A0A0A9CMS5_ARUDO